MELFYNCKIYAPERLTQTQVLTATGKILAIGDDLSVTGVPLKEFDPVRPPSSGCWAPTVLSRTCPRFMRRSRRSMRKVFQLIC